MLEVAASGSCLCCNWFSIITEFCQGTAMRTFSSCTSATRKISASPTSFWNDFIPSFDYLKVVRGHLQIPFRVAKTFTACFSTPSHLRHWLPAATSAGASCYTALNTHGFSLKLICSLSLKSNFMRAIDRGILLGSSIASLSAHTADLIRRILLTAKSDLFSLSPLTVGVSCCLLFCFTDSINDIAVEVQ